MMFSNTRPSTSNGSLLLLVGICAISLSSFICVAATPIDTKNVPNIKNLPPRNESSLGGSIQDKDVADLDELVSPHHVPAHLDQEESLSNLEKELAALDAIPVQPTAQQEHVTSDPEDSQHGRAVQPQKPLYYGAARLTFGQNADSNAEYFLRHNNGQYSSLEMAQYVFWTGDEEGVARAVEEFIQKGLMSRENAIKFLREISLGIEYLENSYANRAQNDQNAESVRGETVTTFKPTTPKTIRSTTSPSAKSIHNLPSLLKTNEISNEKTKDNDETSGRLRIADFLYAEYSLEEVIYQLAKVMFSQSLTRGSEQAQTALQRLTGFLESEGAHGRISPALQKKVLDVLLAALSDCLAEHPELVPIARIGLGNTFDELPNKHSLHKP